MLGLTSAVVAIPDLLPSALQPATAEPKTSPVVVDLALHKAGTSSFADFAYRSLGLTVLHDPAVFFAVSGGTMIEDCEEPSTTKTSDSLPDYAAWSAEMNRTGLLDAVLSTTNIGAWADMPQGLLLEAHERAHGEMAKYVIWPRASDDWVTSFESFFCEDDGASLVDRAGAADDSSESHILGAQPMSANEFKLTYGMCDVCDLAGNRSDVRAANMRVVQEVYDNHLATIDAYFSSSPSRSARLLYMNYSDELAGRTLCEFVYGPANASCAQFTSLPAVDWAELSQDMYAEGAAAFEAALHG